MLRPRIIPCLLIHNKGLVKTINFKDAKYVGDPINAVRIFNEKEVDEIIVIDIDATVNGKEPDFKMIENLASECRMPLCYGGGVKTLEQAERIFSLGVEKIAFSSAAIQNPQLLTKISKNVGNQSVVVVLDVKKKALGGYEVFINNAKKNTGIDLLDFTKQLENFGVGELVINSIDLDGTMKGYDLSLVKEVRKTTSLPLTVLGGAGTLSDIAKLISEFGIIGASAGSLFVFKGVYKAVLINYPNPIEKDQLIKDNFSLNKSNDKQ